jgi:sialate O-acetylesterase
MAARRGLRALALLGAALLAGAAQAEVQLAGLFGDHMVLQREAPIRVWGRADPGERVQVQLATRQARTRADAHGRWQVLLASMPAGGPHQLHVIGLNRLHLSDVMVGEVWVASGQSNMEWSLQDTDDAARAIAAADEPRIRHVKLPHRASLRPQDDLAPLTWQVSQPEVAGRFSAVATYFARRLVRELGVPVGIVDNSWGGTVVETWTSLPAARRDPDLAPFANALPADLAGFQQAQRARAQAIVQRWQPGLPADEPDAGAWAAPAVDDRAWPTLRAPGIWEEQGLPGLDGVVWLRRTLRLDAAQARGPATLHLGLIDDCDESFVNGQRVGGQCGWLAPRDYVMPPGLLQEGDNVIAVRVTDTGGGGGLHGDAAAVRLDTATGDIPLAGTWRARIASVLRHDEPGPNDAPTLLFNGMVQALLPLRVRGVIWYQGESNVPRAARYAGAFRRMILDWRAHWARQGQRRLPFHYVQLTHRAQPTANTLQGSAWAELRDAQRQALALPDTGMAVITDLGDPNDIHPRNKRDVGERLARQALRRTYSRPVVADGPAFASMRVAGARVQLHFRQGTGPLLVRGGGDAPNSFAIADATRRFQPAQARIVGDHIEVWRDGLTRPVAVRYGWFDNTEQADLVNAAGLPASPFRTDRWPLTTGAARYAP